MICIAIDSATPQVSLAIADAGPSGQFAGAGPSGRERGGGPSGRDWGGVEVRASLQVNAGRRHAETLAPGIEYLMEAADVEMKDLDLIAVDIGPGLFTGLRVGVATAKALGDGLGIPVVGVTSTSVLCRAYSSVAGALDAGEDSRAGALDAGEDSSSGALDAGEDSSAGADVVAVVDARRGDVFWAHGKQAPEVCSPEQAAAKIAELGSPVVVVGDGAIRYSAAFEAAGIRVAPSTWSFPDARTLAVVANEAAARGESRPAGEIHPLYLRQPDVRIGWDQASASGKSKAGTGA